MRFAENFKFFHTYQNKNTYMSYLAIYISHLHMIFKATKKFEIKFFILFNLFFIILPKQKIQGELSSDYESVMIALLG